jgi:hypothetical protein
MALDFLHPSRCPTHPCLRFHPRACLQVLVTSWPQLPVILLLSLLFEIRHCGFG